MKKFILPLVLFALFFSCGKKEENSLAIEEKKLWDEINRMDSFPDFDAYKYLKGRSNSDHVWEIREQAEIADSLNGLYSEFAKKVRIGLDRQTTLSYSEITINYKNQVEKYIDLLDKKYLLKDDVRYLKNYSEKLDKLWGYNSRQLLLYSLFQLSSLRQKAMTFLLAGTYSGGCFFAPEFLRTRLTNDSLLVLYKPWGKDLSRDCSIQLTELRKNGKRMDIKLLRPFYSDASKEKEAYYKYSVSGDLASCSLNNSRLSKGSYFFKPTWTEYMPTGEIRIYRDEFYFNRK